MENFPLVLSSSSFKTVAELYYYYIYEEKTDHIHTQTDRERTAGYDDDDDDDGGGIYSCCMCSSSSGSIIGDR